MCRSDETTWPRIIQGGMGVAVSGWRLASAVSRLGQLGVVSGTALAIVVARRLQDGDPGGHLRRALARFPIPEVAQRILDRYFVSGGRGPRTPYRAVPVPRHRPGRHFVELTVVANFAEVHLAKEGHGRPVGINYLEKVQMPTLPSLYGAMLAGVDYVLMGAGIPREIPGILDALVDHEPVSLSFAVTGATSDDDFELAFRPDSIVAKARPALTRPRFLAIVGSHTLAAFLAGSESGHPDGFVVENPTAGGHNAPPRGRLALSPEGEPVYGPRDEVDLGKMSELGLPFWLAGGYAHPERFRQALDGGAAGVQIGTAFALCDESGLDPAIKRRLLDQAADGEIRVFSDPVASPTGYPFKLVATPGSVSDPVVYAGRPRRCDLGYLATPYKRPNGAIGYRCPAEPLDEYVSKGGDPSDTVDRKCLCNGLTANVGLAQRRRGYVEPPLVTLGDDVQSVRLLSNGGRSYPARDVIRHVLDSAGAGR